MQTTMTLAQFEAAMDATQDPRDLIDLALCGRIRSGQDEFRHVSIGDADGGVDNSMGGPYRTSRWVEKAIGVDVGLPYKRRMLVFTAPGAFADVVGADEVVCDFDYNGTTRRMTLAEAPNVVIGSVSDHLVRVVFPALHGSTDNENSPYLSPTTLTDIYERCIRPALCRVTEISSDWPDVLCAARTPTDLSQPYLSVVKIPRSKLADFAADLLQRFNAYPPYSGAKFVHELTVSRDANSQTVIEHLDWQRVENGQGLWTCRTVHQISRPGHVVLWKENAPVNLLNHFVPTLITTRESDLPFARKREAHLECIGDFSSRPGMNGVLHMEAYSKGDVLPRSPTDTRRRTAMEVLPGLLPSLLFDVRGTISDFLVRLQNTPITRKVALPVSPGLPLQASLSGEAFAYLNVRVRLTQAALASREADDVLLSEVDDVLLGNCFSVPAEIWWSFKYHRALAVHKVLEGMQAVDFSFFRASKANLALAALCIIIFNGLNSFPDRAVDLPILQDGERGSNSIGTTDPPSSQSTFTRGLYFISSINFDDEGTPILGTESTISQARLQSWYGVTIRKIEQYLRQNNPFIGLLVEPMGTELADIEEEIGVPTFEGLALWPRTDRSDIDAMMYRMWGQFAQDLFRTAKDKGIPGVVVDPSDMKHITLDEVFQLTDLTGIFDGVGLTSVTALSWGTDIFPLFFPSRYGNHYSGDFARMPYRGAWEMLLEMGDHRDSLWIRARVMQDFMAFRWLPCLTGESVWTPPVDSTQFVPSTAVTSKIGLLVNANMVRSIDAFTLDPRPDAKVMFDH